MIQHSLMQKQEKNNNKCGRNCCSTKAKNLVALLLQARAQKTTAITTKI
jgi:hypothetical protein